MVDDEPSDRPNVPVPTRRAGRARWLGALLLAGALVMLVPVINKLPTERPVRLQVSDPASLRRLDVTWLAGEERIRSTVLRFDEQPASAQITTHVRVLDGDYQLQLRIERSDGVAVTERRVSFAPDVALVVIPIP